MKTYPPCLKTIKNKWLIINAEDKILGRLASNLAIYLMGKNNNEFVPYFNLSNNIVVINVEKIKFTGKKLLKKKYYKHSGYIGNLKCQSLKEKMIKNPKEVLFLAIKNMLPKNKLLSKRLKKIKLFIGNIHPYNNYELEKINI